MRKFHKVDQNSDKWFDLRATKYATGSKAGTIMANYGKAFGEPAKKYAVEIAVQQITGKSLGGGFSNSHTERGHEQEPIARQLYEDENFCSVENGGFFEFGKLGDSPDGLVYDDGLVEIKCVIPTVHYANVKRGQLDPAYKWQNYWHLYVTNREWVDFISYCSEFPRDKQLFTHRIYSENLSDEFKKIKSRTDQFIELVEETKKTILNSDYIIQ
jgi:hypothetical protein